LIKYMTIHSAKLLFLQLIDDYPAACARGFILKNSVYIALPSDMKIRTFF